MLDLVACEALTELCAIEVIDNGFADDEGVGRGGGRALLCAVVSLKDVLSDGGERLSADDDTAWCLMKRYLYDVLLHDHSLCWT